MSRFKPAIEVKRRARICLSGVAGAGKTYLALLMARAFAQGKPVFVLDTEHGSASKYADLFDFVSASPGDFASDVRPGRIPLVQHDPRVFVAALKAAEAEGAAVIIIDSLSHAWLGAQAIVDAIQASTRGGNSYTAWKDVTPMWDGMLDAIMSSPAHIIVTTRAKPAHVLEEREGHNGMKKSVPVKIGLQPVVRDGADHTFDIVLDIDAEHRVTVSKTRMSSLDGRVMLKPGDDLGREVLAWLENPATPRALADERVIEVQPEPAPEASRPAPSPLMARAEALAARLPGKADALEVYARAKDAKAAQAKAGKAFAAMMAVLPESARPGMLDALEKRTAQVEANGNDWLAPIMALTETHDRAWGSACERLGIDPDIEFEQLTGAQSAGLALYLLGL